MPRYNDGAEFNNSDKQIEFVLAGTDIEYGEINKSDLIDTLGVKKYPTGLYIWNETNDGDLTISARDGSGLVNLNGRAYLLGGWDPIYDPVNITNNEVYLLSEDYTTATQQADAGWSKRHTFGYYSDGSDTCYVWGGDGETDVWKGVQNNDLTITWTRLTADAGWGASRFVFGYCFHNGYFYTIGGQSNFTTNENSFTNIYRSADGITWTKIVDNLSFLGKNYSGSAVSYNGYIYLIAGGEYKSVGSTYLNTVYRSVDGITWEQLDNAPFDGRQYTNCLVHENKIFVLFGNDGAEENFNKNDCWTFDGINWEQIPLGATARHATACVSIENKLIIATGNYWNDCWVLEHNTQDLVNTKYNQTIDGEKRFNDQISAISGVGFGNSNPAVLNHYEEGTWIPSNSGVTLTGTFGRYTRIGNVVNLFFAFTFPTNANGGNAEIQGLPYSAGTSVVNGASIGFTNDSDNYTIVAINGVLQVYTRAGALTTNAQNSGKYYFGVLTYRVG